MELLDVACGTGAIIAEAVRRGARQVTASDIAHGMVERVAATASSEGFTGSVDAVVADGQALPAAWTGRFDAATSLFGLIFFADARAGLGEMARVVRPGGNVAIGAWGAASETPAFQVIPAAAAELARTSPSAADALGAVPKSARLGAEEVAELARELGLRDVRVVGPAVRTLQVASAEAYWERFSRGAPGTRALLAALAPTDADALKASVLARLSQMAAPPGGGAASPEEPLTPGTSTSTVIGLDASAYFVIATVPPGPAAA